MAAMFVRLWSGEFVSNALFANRAKLTGDVPVANLMLHDITENVNIAPIELMM